jgi:hypothetical protein
MFISLLFTLGPRRGCAPRGAILADRPVVLRAPGGVHLLLVPDLRAPRQVAPHEPPDAPHPEWIHDRLDPNRGRCATLADRRDVPGDPRDDPL